MEENHILTRRHEILADRAAQIEINLLALSGGAPYVKRRLSRFPGESDLAWRGFEALGGVSSLYAGNTSEIHGRRDRTYDHNLPGRIVQKMNQYVFATPVKRDGVNERFLEDATRERVSLPQLMRRVLALQQACGWCWLRVDGPAPLVDEHGNMIVISRADRAERGILPFWAVHNPLSVVDWEYDNAGRLIWVLQETFQSIFTGPFTPRVKKRIRVSWEPGRVTFFQIGGNSELERQWEADNPPDFVPWIPHGNISPDPWYFDGLESRNRSIMNLTSVGDDVAQEQCYGQLVIPADAIQNAVQAANGTLSPDQAAQMILGKAHPLLEGGDTKGVSRYITPSRFHLSLIDEKTEAKKRDLFEWVGFALKPETAQAESAAAKAWDHLDVRMVLADNAEALQETEGKAVAMTRRLDPNFEDYEPVYATTFDVGDIQQEMAAIIGLNNLTLPHEARKQLARGAFVKLRDRGVLKITDEAFNAALDAIDAMNEGELVGGVNDPAFLDQADEETS